MPIKEILLTQDGLNAMVEELDHLKSVKRKEIAEKIKVALSFGDLSENSEYDEAKNDQAQLEGRIADLEARLKHAKIIDESDLGTEVVNVGSHVKILDVEFNDEVTYQIVGSTEADPLKGSISDESPVGRSLLGHFVDDVVEVETPGGIIEYKILEISK